MPPTLEFRPPRTLRVFMALFGTVWCGAIGIPGAIDLANGSRSAIADIGMAMFGVVIFAVYLRTAVLATPTDLVVRNWWLSRRIARREIVGFGIRSIGGPLTDAVFVTLRDRSSVPLYATRRANPLAGGRERVEAQRLALERWHRSIEQERQPGQSLGAM